MSTLLKGESIVCISPSSCLSTLITPPKGTLLSLHPAHIGLGNISASCLVFLRREQRIMYVYKPRCMHCMHACPGQWCTSIEMEVASRGSVTEDDRRTDCMLISAAVAAAALRGIIFGAAMT